MQSLRETSSDPVMRLPSGRPEIGEMVIGELGNVGRHAKNSIAIHSRRPRRLHLHRRRRTQPGALRARSCGPAARCQVMGGGVRRRGCVGSVGNPRPDTYAEVCCVR